MAGVTAKILSMVSGADGMSDFIAGCVPADGFREVVKEQRVPPLRCAPVGMTEQRDA